MTLAVRSRAADFGASRRRKRVGVAHLVRAAALSAAIFAILFPILWIALTALKPPDAIYSGALLFRPTFENFVALFAPPWTIGSKLVNSTVVALGTVAIAVPVATLAAYAFSRFDFVLKRSLFFLLLATQFIPAVVIILPFFMMYRDLGLLDTRWGLIIIDVAFATPFATWMLKGFMDGVPRESEEAALVDGATRLRVIVDIVVPMIMPGIVTAAVFCFIVTWNEFIFALILTRNNAVTLTRGLLLFRTDHGDAWELMASAGIIVTLPMFVLALIVQKHFERGIMSGAVR